MTNSSLALSYLKKAQARLKTLPVLQAEGAYSDVVREAQEIVELALKAMLRQVGIEPPKWHDVGNLLAEHRDRFDAKVRRKIPRMARASRWLRKERELSFYGDIDFIPSDEYGPKDATRAATEAAFIVKAALLVIGKNSPQ